MMAELLVFVCVSGWVAATTKKETGGEPYPSTRELYPERKP